MSNLSSSQRIGNRTPQLRCDLDFVALQEKLRCEYGPATARSDDIVRILSDVDKDIEDCDIEVDRLQSRLIVLQNQRRLLKEYRTRVCFLQSPIRRLPNETIMRIFDYACGTNWLTLKNIRDMPTLAISGVCAHWRDLVKTCPSLWSCIRLEIQSIPLNGFPILDLYHESSQQSPLTIGITGTIETLEPHHLAVCAALAAQASRWQELAVYDSAQVYRALMSQASHYLMLQALVIPQLTYHPAANCYENFPQLYRLSAGSIPSENLANHQFPWKQLRSLSLAHHPRGMENILSICENLTELHFKEDLNTAEVSELSLPPTAVPILETLTLLVVDTPLSKSLAEVVFSSTTCPSLTSLYFVARYGIYRRPWPKETLHKFMSRSSCSLTTLSLKYIPLSDADLIDLLRCIPSLLHFTLHDSVNSYGTPITSQLIQALHAFPPPASSVLVQRLQTLHLGFSGSNFNDREFVDMLSSRWLPDDRTHENGLFSGNILNSGVGTLCLRSVVIHFGNRKMDENEYRRLIQLEKAGMRVVLFNAIPKFVPRYFPYPPQRNIIHN